jgi:CRISPR-associated protein Csd1
MILQALYEYYQKKAEVGSSDAAPRGFQWKGIPFLIVIDRDGRFVRIEDTQERNGNRLKAKSFLVPLAPIRAGAVIRPGLLWDQLEYAVGANPRGRKDVEKRFRSFKARLNEELSQISDPLLDALKTFLTDRPSEQIAAALSSDEWEKLQAKNPFVTFRVEGEATIPEVLFDRLRNREIKKPEASAELFCPVTGDRGQVPSLHSKIKGVWGGLTQGGTLVSFNLDAFESFGKTQNNNAQMSEIAAEGYTKALNMLLESETNRLQLGDASTVFWAQMKDSFFEKNVKSFFFALGKERDDPDRDAPDARAKLLSIISGMPPEEMETKFFILGLSPNAARISVRFWHQGTVGEFCKLMRKHFDDIDIIAPSFDQCRMSLQYLLGSTVRDWKSEDIPPNLTGNVIRAVLNGSPYPETFANQCLRRVRAERDVTRVRASILKACLNRKLRISKRNNEKEMTVALDPSNTNVGYRLGRLFAVLEKIQEDANPGINATIRDRFYGAASSNPVAVFPQLLKLKNHHLSKMENQGFKIAHEKRLAEIIDGLSPAMPAHLVMDDQARFAIGYYHQRQALFTSNKDGTKGA